MEYKKTAHPKRKLFNRSHYQRSEELSSSTAYRAVESFNREMASTVEPLFKKDAAPKQPVKKATKFTVKEISGLESATPSTPTNKAIVVVDSGVVNSRNLNKFGQPASTNTRRNTQNTQQTSSYEPGDDHRSKPSKPKILTKFLHFEKVVDPRASYSQSSNAKLSDHRNVGVHGKIGHSHSPYPYSTNKSISASPSFDFKLAFYKYLLWPCSDFFDWLKDWKEDTLRLWLMAFVLLSYMGFGCAIFSYLEFDYEQKIKESINNALNNFTSKYPNVDKLELRTLLDIYGNATYNGFIGVRPRWDTFGALYFTWTVVSTVGYGMTTPHTLAGKLFLMVYGLLGCAGGILFFNLFLERVINLLANTLRWLHSKRKSRRKSLSAFAQQTLPHREVLVPRDDLGNDIVRSSINRPRFEVSQISGNAANSHLNSEHFSRMPIQTNNPSQAMKVNNVTKGKSGAGAASRQVPQSNKAIDDDAGLEKWKPSVYWVLIILFLLTCFVGCTVSILYSAMENWSYTDSLYFCFISFATIGFGDFVSNQKVTYEHVIWYKIVNFIILALGSCCVYSLLNVISIVIKQFLNLILNRFKRECWRHCRFCLSKSNRERFGVEQKVADKAVAKKRKKVAKREGEAHKRAQAPRHLTQQTTVDLNDTAGTLSDPKMPDTLTLPNIMLDKQRGSGISIHALTSGIIKWKRKKGTTILNKSTSRQMSDETSLRLTIPNPMVESISRHPLLHDDEMDTFNTVYVGPLPQMDRKFSDRSEYYSRSPWRKDSGDLVSMQDFLEVNKPDRLEDLQRQLLETNKKVGFSNKLFLPYGASLEDELIQPKPPLPVASIVEENFGSPELTKIFVPDISERRSQLVKMTTQENQKRLPFNIVKSEPKGFHIKREIVYNHRKPFVPTVSNVFKSTNIIISTDTDYDEEEQILRDHKRGQEISLKELPREGKDDGLAKNGDKHTTKEEVIPTKRTVKSVTTTSPFKYKLLSTKEDSLVKKIMTPLEKKYKLRDTHSTTEGEEGVEDEEEDENSETSVGSGNQSTTESEDEGDDHKLCGEEVGPLAILNKTLGEKH